MLGENIKSIRKRRGLTQEELAIRLHIVRQTVSKWEKGLSVPDADALQRLAEVLEVDIRELLGAPASENQTQTDAVAEQLSRINEQLAVKNRRARRIWRIVGIVLLAWLGLNTLIFVLNFSAVSRITTTKPAEVGSIIYEVEAVVVEE